MSQVLLGIEVIEEKLTCYYYSFYNRRLYGDFKKEVFLPHHLGHGILILSSRSPQFSSVQLNAGAHCLFART